MLLNKIKNIEEAAERIKQAAQGKERIILYGDSDLDGIVSVVILEETIKNLGGRVDTVAFPNREEDGYGINLKAMEFLKNKAPALFITLDLGISNVKEVAVANKICFEVIIIDHHQILDRLPGAKIIIDPEQKDDKYPFKGLCTAGITFKLCQEILEKNMSLQLKNSFIELVALATIADMMPQVADNKIFIEEGLRSLPNTFRPGLRAFIDILGSPPTNFESKFKNEQSFESNSKLVGGKGKVAAGGFTKIISALNAAESVDFRNDSYELLTNSSSEKCREIAETLLAKVQQKQQRIKEITSEVEKRIVKKPDEIIIFEGDIAWKLTLAGPVASIIASKYEKPTFIFKKGDKESCGSVRSLKEGQNSVEAMKSCKELLVTYGGHPKASGFRVKNENLEEFKKCLIEYFRR